jgi:hypothetical protein
MMKRLLLPLTAIAVAGILYVSAQPAYACSCGYVTPQQEIRNADLIVVGTVNDVRFEGPINEIGADLAPGYNLHGQPGTNGLLTISVEHVLKGTGRYELIVAQTAISVTKNLDGSVSAQFDGGENCALFIGLPMNERYLLFLHPAENDDAFNTSWCAGSMRLDDENLSYGYPNEETYLSKLAEYDAAFGLSAGSFLGFATAPPGALPDLGGAPPARDVFPWLELISAGALLAAGGWLLRRRRTPA